jgi:hypothetical protein
MLKGGVVITSGRKIERPLARINEGLGDLVMEERPRLVLPPLVRGEPFEYCCSRCGQAFLLPEDRTPKEGILELWTAFKQHVEEEHPGGADRTERTS